MTIFSLLLIVDRGSYGYLKISSLRHHRMMKLIYGLLWMALIAYLIRGRDLAYYASLCQKITLIVKLICDPFLSRQSSRNRSPA